MLNPGEGRGVYDTHPCLGHTSHFHNIMEITIFNSNQQTYSLWLAAMDMWRLTYVSKGINGNLIHFSYSYVFIHTQNGVLLSGLIRARDPCRRLHIYLGHAFTSINVADGPFTKTTGFTKATENSFIYQMIVKTDPNISFLIVT